VVAGRIHPTDQGHGLIDVGKAELIAMMCAHDSFGGRVLNPENEKKSMDFCVVTGIKPEKASRCQHK
jgi:hypothetical protein